VALLSKGVRKKAHRLALRLSVYLSIVPERQVEFLAQHGLSAGAPTARAKTAEIIALAKQGASKEKIAKQVAVGVASVYRVLAAASAQSGLR
jgi:DNA invertase Pin-like site-specific DNA recombinase